MIDRRKGSDGGEEDGGRSGPTYSAPALEKGIDVIELLTQAPQGLTISDIAHRLDRSISELFRVIVVLARRGWLVKDEAGDRYRVTYRLLDIAHRATPAHDLLHIALPQMRDLAEKIRQSCHLVVSVDQHGLIIARQESPGVASFALRVGGLIDLVNSCSGRILLAYMDAKEREDALGGRPGPSTRDLNAVRKAGQARMNSRRLSGVRDLGCPVFGFDGRILASLTVPYLTPIDTTETPSIDQCHALLASSAADISRQLGWTG